MSLARAIAFDPQAGMLLRYGLLRQQADDVRADFSSGGQVVLPQVLREGVLPSLLKSLPAAGGLDVIMLQRTSAWVNQLCWELASGTLVRVLEAMTGLSHLLPDPYFCCGGLVRGTPAPLPARHRHWQLPPALVLDIVLHGGQAVSGSGRLLEGNALLWLATGTEPTYASGSDALLWRHVFFYGLREGE